jgi:glutamyl-tRNA synthetase
MSQTRVRFAPSPTGVLHVGGARTALFNYLFAKSTGGVFVLRVEDTDRVRSTEEAVKVIMDGLTWLGLDPDEGPFFQTKRTDLYLAGIERLLAEGKAYRCACTAEELSARREAAQAEKRTYRYDRTCRDRDVPADVPHTIRAAFPITGKTAFHDLLRGDVVVDNTELDDIIIARTDGTPTYNFTVVMDDVDMGITHVLRGDDHLSNTPKQVVLYELLGMPVPEFAHFPMILGPDGAKLSKRHGAVSVLEYEELGYLPETMLSCLARLGWSHGDQEEFTLSELEDLFSLKHVGKTAAVFDIEKVTHFNHHFLRELSAERLIAALRPFLVKRGYDPDVRWLPIALDALRERSRTLVEMVDWLEPFYAEEIVYDPKARKKNLKPAKTEALPTLADALEGLETFDAAATERVTNEWLAANDLELKKVGQAIRVAITGRAVSPPLYDTMEILGREKVVARLRAAPEVAARAGENP